MKRAGGRVKRALKGAVPRRYRYVIRGAALRLVGPLFRGENVTCPCCARRSRRWVSFGYPNRLCPRCSSSERSRLLMLYLRNETPFFSDGECLTVAHFAAEYSLMRQFSRLSNLDYIAADLDPPFGGIEMDIRALPLAAQSVDIAICSHVLEHVPEDGTAMAELRRVLRPGGLALVMVPRDPRRATTYEDHSITTPEGRLVAFGQDDHVRVYGLDFEDRLRAAGFEVAGLSYTARLGPEAIDRYGLDEADVIFVCS
jgi:SAM-dependent methyltransferase